MAFAAEGEGDGFAALGGGQQRGDLAGVQRLPGGCQADQSVRSAAWRRVSGMAGASASARARRARPRRAPRNR
jgi:hypothetical protein